MDRWKIPAFLSKKAWHASQSSIVILRIAEKYLYPSFWKTILQVDLSEYRDTFFFLEKSTGR